MTFKELKHYLEKNFGTSKLADIAREMNVSPQVVNSWKSRDQVPYKYIKNLREKVIEQQNVQNVSDDNNTIFSYKNYEEDSFLANALNFLSLMRDNLFLIISTIGFILSFTFIYVTFIVSPTYKSTATIIPRSENKNDIKGLAAQFGIGGSSEQTDFAAAELYPYIINSRTLHDSLLIRKFSTKKFGASKPLYSILVETDTNDSERFLTDKIFANKKLDQLIRVNQIYNSPVIYLTVYGFEPAFARDLANAVIDELDKTQKRFKLASVKEKRRFIEKRVAVISRDLKKAEEDLRVFREKNRNILSSPSLMLEQQRLLREVEVQMAVYITVKQELEFVQIEQVENSSKMVILDKPDKPVSRISPRRFRSLALSLLFGIIFSVGLVYAIDLFKKNKDKIINHFTKSK
tara:strand:+ start:111 stop:1325 length:1215 start_codon:yes stop_codon:yes gene_type:complete